MKADLCSATENWFIEPSANTAMIVTIDGPSGTGKSSAAKGLAQRLGFEFLNTGAMYRVVAWRCLRTGTNPQLAAAAGKIALEMPLEFDHERALVEGRDVTDELRLPDVADAASLVAQHAEVRTALVAQQRKIAAGRNIVCEGRDQGSWVFPDAACKFYLTAAPWERARRRQQELAQQAQAVSLENLLLQQTQRDTRDAERSLAPLKPAHDALQIDTTHLSGGEVIDLLERHVRAHRLGPKK